jgi:hypothetical protein
MLAQGSPHVSSTPTQSRKSTIFLCLNHLFPTHEASRYYKRYLPYEATTLAFVPSYEFVYTLLQL